MYGQSRHNMIMCSLLEQIRIDIIFYCNAPYHVIRLNKSLRTFPFPETFEVDITNTKKLLEGERGQIIAQKDVIVSIFFDMSLVKSKKRKRKYASFVSGFVYSRSMLPVQSYSNITLSQIVPCCTDSYTNRQNESVKYNANLAMLIFYNYVYLVNWDIFTTIGTVITLLMSSKQEVLASSIHVLFNVSGCRRIWAIHS